jgi:hypothetical protein
LNFDPAHIEETEDVPERGEEELIVGHNGAPTAVKVCM